MGNMGSLFHNTHNTKCQEDLATCRRELATCQGDLTHEQNLNKVEEKSAKDLINYVAETYQIDKQELNKYYFKQRIQHMNPTHGGTRKRKRRKSRHSK